MKLRLAINDNDDPITEPVPPANGEHYDVIDEPLAERARPLRSAHRFDEVSIWAMAEEKWNEGMRWIIKSKIDLVAPSRRD